MTPDYRHVQRQNFSDQVTAGRYTERTQHAPSEQRFMLDTFAAALGEQWSSPRQLSVLDCGMGTGRTLEMLATGRPWGALTVSGFDLTPAMVAQCEQRLARLAMPQVVTRALSVGDITDPASYSGSHDVVYCMLVIQQLPLADQRRAIANMLSAIAPTGRVIVFDRERWSRYGLKMAVRKAETRWLGLRLVPPHFLAARYPCLSRLARYCHRKLGYTTEIRHDEPRELFALVIRPQGTRANLAAVEQLLTLVIANANGLEGLAA